ncbi:lactate racemase domain-containing protein [Anaeroselena agilis]|uniref:Lactate racemase domain-containing protein n=1 Tax=Anaeroselena agilis TaxID=3063788 RepID=A0ABU3NSV3_9FIRM|nr:lactate racemase domain-containing protein [Selenomonadales bacterium 4137-cl]
MDVIQELLREVPLPRMVKIRQAFPASRIGDVAATLRQELARDEIGRRVRPGMKVAVAVGSRGVADIPILARVTVEELKRMGAEPFIVPAMGSHGGATADGQREVLANLGVTEESAGCPIKSSMAVVEIGRLDNGLPVYIDEFAYNADGIVVINRIKPHTAFRGPNESGLVKMITIGLGKQKGAESCHAFSFKYMAEHIPAMAGVVLAKMPVLFGVGTVENAYDQVAKIVAVTPENLIETDRQLLLEAKANMASLPFSQIDVLVVDKIGKDISGDGMDPNITGRYPTPYASGGPDIAKLAVLDLTDATHGNANGMGTADITTRRLVNKTNFPMTYCNGLTSTVLIPTKVPAVFECDRDAVKAAIKTCNARDLKKARVVRIQDTLHLEEIRVSEALLEEVRANPRLMVCGDPEELRFDDDGNLVE